MKNVPSGDHPAASIARSSLAVGSVFAGDFKILKRLAKGGMGTVFEAEQLSTGRRRALKVLRLAGQVDEAVRQRFMREARACALIESEHVVEVVVAGGDEATSTLWIAMEFLEGQTLAERLTGLGSGAAIPMAEAWALLAEVLRGMTKAHARGVVHRDLKPSNIFLRAGSGDASAPSVKLLDFGIACFLDGEDSGANTSPIGTPLWMAPEQCRPSRMTPAVDVWAIGLLAFRLFSGRNYWVAGNSPTPIVRELLTELLCEPLEPASERAEALGCVGRLPMGFDGWFARCVAREPLERFANASEAAAALAKIAPAGVVGAMLVPSNRRTRSGLHAAVESVPPGAVAVVGGVRRPVPAYRPPLGAPARRAHESTPPPVIRDPPPVDRDDPAEAPTLKTRSVRPDFEPVRPRILLLPEGSLPAAPAEKPARSPRRHRALALAAIVLGVVAAIAAPRGVVGRALRRWQGAKSSVVAGADERAPQPTSGASSLAWADGAERGWSGTASSRAARYAFVMTLRMGPAERVVGFISWTVVRSPDGRVGEQVRENVEGTYEPTLGTIDLHGTMSTNPILYPVSAYHLRLLAGGALDGRTFDDAVTLEGARP